MVHESRLPSEVVDAVIDHLNDDYAALNACSLVSKSWVNTSRYHLFHSIILGRSIKTTPPFPSCPFRGFGCRGDRLFAALQSSPELASYIINLAIEPRSLLRDFEALAPLLHKLTALRTLSICARTAPRTPLSPAITSAIGSLPNLQHLRLQNLILNDPAEVLHLLRHSKSLKEAHITGLDFFTSLPVIVVVEESQETNDGVETLSIDSSFLAKGLIQQESPISIASVRNISARILATNQSAIVNLLHAATSLECLDIDLLTDPEPTLSIDLSSLPSLKNISIRFPTLLGRGNPLFWLYAVFSSVPADNMLQELSLVAIIDYPPPYLRESMFRAFLQAWRHLDDLLTQPQFASLQRVRIDFMLDTPLEDQVGPWIVSEIIGALPTLSRRGILHVDSCEIR